MVTKRKSTQTRNTMGGAGGMEGIRQRMSKKKPLKPFPSFDDAMKQAKKGQ